MCDRGRVRGGGERRWGVGGVGVGSYGSNVYYR